MNNAHTGLSTRLQAHAKEDAFLQNATHDTCDYPCPCTHKIDGENHHAI